MRLVRLVQFAVVALVLLALAGSAFAQFQQPTPGEEEVGTKPTPTYPEPRSSALRAIDLGVFVVMLAASTVFIIKYKSRKLMMLTAAASLVYFGLWRSGCVCPIGSIQNIALSLTDSTYTISIFITIIFLLPIIFSLIFGRVFCGGLCPLGAIQAWLNPSKFFIRVPEKLDRFLGVFRWVYLLAAIWLAVGGIKIFGADLSIARRFIICETDPFVGIFRTVNLRSLTGGSGDLLLNINAGTWWYLTAGVILLSVIFVRPYCRWACPYGAVLGLCAKAARKPVTLTPRVCPDCKMCDDACPVNAIKSGEIDPAHCVACGRCHAACPVERFDRNIPVAAPALVLPPQPAHKKQKPQRTAIKAASIAPLDEELDLSYLPQLIETAQAEGSGALKILMGIQQVHGYLPASALARAEQLSEFSRADLIATSSFYNMFRYEPVGEHLVSVCHGTACHVAGAGGVTDALRRHLNIAAGRDTDDAGKFTVEKIACLGCCSLAPVMQVDGVTYGHLTGQSACEIIDRVASGKIAAPPKTEREDSQLPASPTQCQCNCSSKGNAGGEQS